MILSSGGHATFATYRLDDEEKELYQRIADGKKVVGNGDERRKCTLLRLRRNGLIDNHGTRSHPDWRLSERWRKKNFVIMDLDDNFWMWV